MTFIEKKYLKKHNVGGPSMDNITMPFAFVAGIMSFFSPCVFPLIPAYLASLTGLYAKDNDVDVTKSILMARSASFIVGFSLVFMAMGASASLIGRLFAENRNIIEKVGGILITIFGLQMAGVLNIRFLMREMRWQTSQNQESSIWRSFLLGMAFGAGWTPCVGLALSSILLLAGASETIANGVLLLLIYSLGIGVPFLIISLIISHSLTTVIRINNKLGILSVVNGGILIVLGILLFNGQLQTISAWLAAFTYFNY